MPDENNQDPDEIIETAAGVPTLHSDKIDVPFQGHREGTLGDMLNKGAAHIRATAAELGHHIGVRIIDEETAATLREQYKPKGPMEAEAELLGLPTSGSPEAPQIARGSILTDTTNNHRVTAVQCNVGKTPQGSSIHVVIDNKTGRKYKISERKLTK